MLMDGLFGNTKNAVALMSKPKGGLTKWFKEDWVDIKTGKKCGRKKAKGSSRPYPACRPKAVAAKMTKAEKEAAKKKKTGPKPIKYAVTASGKRRKAAKKTA
jgi:hypothetical protein